MAGKFYGVGVGPGDPELMTLKAVKVLKEVDYICTPQTAEGNDSIALSIVKEKVNCHGRIMRLNFPMTYSKSELENARDTAAAKMKRQLNNNKSIAFITIGDPLLYSTYIYILNRLHKSDKRINIETVPGITSIAACTASNNLPLAKNNENIAILPEVKDESKLEKTLKMFDTTVVMKLSRNFKTVYKLLNRMGLKENSFIASRCGQSEEFYTEDLDSVNENDIDYLSLLISRQEDL